MSKQTADFRSVRSTLRRRRGLIVFATLVGLAGGAGYVITEPPPLTSTTLVLLPTPALAESSNSDVVTQVRGLRPGGRHRPAVFLPRSERW